MYLLDTNVVSELRRARPHGAVVAWLGGLRNADLHLAAATVGEVAVGIEATRGRDPAKAADLEQWLDDIVRTFNVLPMEGRTFRTWARLFHGRSDDLYEDAMIAATALVHDLTVATRNTRDFAPFGVRTLDPFRA